MKCTNLSIQCIIVIQLIKVPGVVLSPRDTAVNQIDKNPTCILVQGDMNQIISDA